LREESEQQIFGMDSKGDWAHFPRRNFCLEAGCDLLLKTGRTVRIRTGRTTTSLGMKIEASVGTVFEAAFGEFSVGGRPYRREGTTTCCGHKNRGVDFSKAVQLYGFGTIF
jgi:hypothetical protein